MLWPLALAVALTGLPCAVLAQALSGAGATFPVPLYAKWGEAAHAGIGIELHYQAVGSSAGQAKAIERSVDFGASDSPVPPATLASARLLQFPTAIGAVVVIVNLPRLRDGQLRLTGEALADIYAGRIAKWNDPRLAELNPATTLPNIPIAPIHRYEASGTSFVFTSYLSAASPAWRDGFGAGNSVKWPSGAGARGSDGVATTVLNTRGGIGYVESNFAAENHLATAQLRNKAGAYVRAGTASIAAAASAADWSVPDFAVSLVDAPGAASWPIATTTFILLPKNPTYPARSATAMRFFDWCYRNGNDIARQLDYVPLPPAVQDAVRAAWGRDVAR